MIDRKKEETLWKKYCGLLGVNPFSSVICNSEYYKEGFDKFKVQQGSYTYYRYMSLTR